VKNGVNVEVDAVSGTVGHFGRFLQREAPMSAERVPRNRVSMCPGCGLYPHTHNSTHRLDCTAEQIPEYEALANIAEIFGPHLTPQSAAELNAWKAQQHERKNQ
jgi:hypothetical protein